MLLAVFLKMFVNIFVFYLKVENVESQEMHAIKIPSQLLYTVCVLHPGHPLSGYYKVMDTVEFVATFTV